MNVVVDSETSGLPIWSLPMSDPSQPWIPQLAAELFDDDGKPFDFFRTRILADGRKIKPDAQAVHGMSSAAAGRNGVSEIVALGMLAGFIAQARCVVGHGILVFDRKVIEGVLERKGKSKALFSRPGLLIHDTMLGAVSFCQIEKPKDDERGGYKWPSLDEACSILLNEPPREGPHDAWDDCQRAKRLFLFLRSKGVFDEPANEDYASS